MPEEFVVLRCKECRMFQKHISGKSTKFCCKICGEKQSIIRCYGNGSGPECRRTVQRLNSTCAEADSDEVDEELERYSDELHEDVLRKNGYNRKEGPNAAKEVDEDFHEAESEFIHENGGTENNNDEGFEEEYLSSSKATQATSRTSPIDCPAKETDTVNSNGSKYDCNGFASGDISCNEKIDVCKNSDQSPKAKRSKYSIF